MPSVGPRILWFSFYRPTAAERIIREHLNFLWYDQQMLTYHRIHTSRTVQNLSYPCISAMIPETSGGMMPDDMGMMGDGMFSRRYKR